MDFSLTEDQKMLRTMVRDFATKELEPVAAQIDKTAEYPAEQVKKIIVPEMNIGKYVGEIERASEGMAKVVSLPLNKGRIHTSSEILAGIKGGTRR